MSEEKVRVDFRVNKDLLKKFDDKTKKEHRDRTKTLTMLMEMYVNDEIK